MGGRGHEGYLTVKLGRGSTVGRVGTQISPAPIVQGQLQSEKFLTEMRESHPITKSIKPCLGKIDPRVIYVIGE